MGVLEEVGGGGVSIQEGCCVVSEGGGGEEEEGAALCYYVSEHHRGTQDLSAASGTRGGSLHGKTRIPVKRAQLPSKKVRKHIILL